MTEGAPSYLGAFKTAEDVSGYSKLWYTRNGKCSQAFIIKACSTGFLLCLPQGAISEEELDQAILTEYQDVLGPWTTPSVVAVGVHGRELKKTLPVLIIDVQASEIAAVTEEPVYGTERLSFGTVRLQSVWPSRVKVLEALEAFLNGEELLEERLEGYFTATSDAELTAPALANPLLPVGADSQGDGEVLHQLLQQSSAQANLLQGIQDRLVTLDDLDARLTTLEQQPGQPRSSALPPTQGEGAPTWAPQLFSDGGQAKLATDQIQQLLALAGRGPQTLGDIGGAANLRGGGAVALGAAPKAKAALPVIPGPPGADAEEDDEAEPEADVGEAGMLAKLLAQQTKILGQLASSSRKQADPLQNLLGGGGSSEEDPKVPGVRGMAARQLLREQFAAHPEKVIAKIRERLAAARRKDVSSLEPRDMYLHFQETVPLGSYKTLTYFAFLLAECWEAAEKGQAQDMVALVGLGLVFAEQVANEQGHTRLGWLLTGRADPPFALVEQRKAPRSEVPHGMLADPRWVTANLAYLRDAPREPTRGMEETLLPSKRTQKIRPKVVAEELAATRARARKARPDLVRVVPASGFSKQSG